MNKTQLEAKVAARNAVHALVLEILPKVRAAVAPLVGKKVACKAGGLTVAAQKVLDPLRIEPSEFARHLWFRVSDYSLSVEFRTCEIYPLRGDASGSAYADSSWTIGDIREGTLTSLYEGGQASSVRTDYTVAEVEKLREVESAARKTADDTKYALCHFGTRDNH